MAAQAEHVGPYRIERQLGAGSSAIVYLAQHRSNQGWVALKLFEPKGAGTPDEIAEHRQRFAAEVQIVQRLHHPDIVAVLDAGEIHGRPWLATELATGSTLTRYTLARRLLPPAKVMAIGRRLALALDHAHSLGVVHRDVKPSNVLLDLADDRIKLTDFGTARLLDQARTHTELMLGTPAYMAPELLAGEAASPRSDLYSLGVMLFELLAGRRPHESASLGELLRLVAAEPAPDLCLLRPALPRAAADLVAGLLAKPAQLRPASGRWVAEQMQALSAAGLANPTQAAGGGLISR